MLEKIVKDGRKLVTIIDPHAKIEDAYWIYHETKTRSLAVKDLNGEDYVT
jgi:alpha-glucosidase (family GH31 glycosyl hydrolase)